MEEFQQETIADSITKIKYITASEAAKEAVWVRKFILELGVVRSIIDPIPLYCDKKGSIAQAKEPRSQQRSKCVLRRCHLIREIIGKRDVIMEKVPTDQDIVDPLLEKFSKCHHLYVLYLFIINTSSFL